MRKWAVALGCLALAFAAWGLVRLNTWYLASDQFAFLNFARDLRLGSVLHADETLALIAPAALPDRTYDALAQTYYWHGGKLYSRYPPGFPVLLAVAGLIGGEVGEHALNPLLYLIALCVLGLLTHALLRDADPDLAAGAAAASLWLLLLLPTQIHLWGITVARDLPAHLLALLALLAAVRGAGLWAGLALGAACTVRPDAILYGISLAAVAAYTRPRLREIVLAAVAFAIALSPLLLYNWAALGHPLRFTQGAEFRDLLSQVIPQDGIVLVSDFATPSGGAFKLENLAVSLPGNLRYLGRAFGWFAALAGVGLVWSLLRCRILAAAFVPYPVIAVLFYSCWSHPDPRYLAGVGLCMTPLAAVGAAALCEGLARARAPARIASLLLIAIVLARASGWIPLPGLPDVNLPGYALTLAIGAVGIAGFVRPLVGTAIKLAPLVPAIALALAGLVLVSRSRGARDPFQHEQVERARAAVGQLIPPGSLVITSPALGRPAENLRIYSDVEAFYDDELPLVRTNADQAAVLFILTGRRAFFLLDAADKQTLRNADRVGEARVVERRRGDSLLEWYVDPRRAPFGAILYELVISEEKQKQILEYMRAAESARREELRAPARPDIVVQ